MFLLGRAQQLAPFSYIIKSIILLFFTGEDVAISHPSLYPVLLQYLLNPWASGERQGKRESILKESGCCYSPLQKKLNPTDFFLERIRLLLTDGNIRPLIRNTQGHRNFFKKYKWPAPEGAVLFLLRGTST